MRTTISALTTVAAAAVLAVVTVFIPNLPKLTGPLVISVLVALFAVAWPMLVSTSPRWGVSAGLGAVGLAAVWTVALLPADTTFSSQASELWLAPVGGAAALGMLIIFVIQTFTLPGGVKRFLTTAMLGAGAVIASSAGGWTMLFRHKYEAAHGALEVERISGVTWLMLTILAALAVAALATLLPIRRRNRITVTIIGATVVAVALQFIRPGVLSVPAVIASALAGLLVGLADSFSDTQETSAVALRHPLTAVAVGSGSTIVTGMVSYFVIHVLPW